MEKIKVLIVEDNGVTAMDLSELLEKNGFEVPKICVSGEDVLPWLKNNVVDIILLDKNLGGKITGIEVAQEIQTLFQIPFIYLTALADHETIKEMVKTKPSAYLNKPFKEVDLLSAIEIAIDPIKENDEPNLVDLTKNKNSFFLKNKGKFQKLYYNDILWIEADRSYTHIITKNGKITMTISLGNFLEKINNPIFLRVHRSYVVNFELIENFDDSYVSIQGQEIPISKNIYNKLVEKLNIL